MIIYKGYYVDTPDVCLFVVICMFVGLFVYLFEKQRKREREREEREREGERERERRKKIIDIVRSVVFQMYGPLC